VSDLDVEFINDGRAIEVTISGIKYKFHAVWLRDNVQDASTRSPGNGQRLITILDIPSETTITGARWVNQNLELTFAPNPQTAFFSQQWLSKHAPSEKTGVLSAWVSDDTVCWDKSLQDKVPRADFNSACKGRHQLGSWLAAIRRYGFAVMTGVPTQSGDLCNIVDLFGFVRETNYGRWFDVRAEVNPSNLAYTNLGLQAHTDNPYRDPVPTLQILSCLENSVDGGESTVVDGFAVATRLRDEMPEGFGLLTKYCANFEYRGSTGVRLKAKKPIIELGQDGELLAIRFNNRSAAAFTDVSFEDMEGYYAAYRRFAEIVEDPDMEVTFKLEPGEAFIVDNTRVLHARKFFQGSGKRWLQGCYADIDGLYSTLSAIEEEGLLS
jgi:[2-(trimethylamino)ethyl]phosphonate dioxygenase